MVVTNVFNSALTGVVENTKIEDFIYDIVEALKFRYRYEVVDLENHMVGMEDENCNGYDDIYLNLSREHETQSDRSEWITLRIEKKNLLTYSVEIVQEHADDESDGEDVFEASAFGEIDLRSRAFILKPDSDKNVGMLNNDAKELTSIILNGLVGKILSDNKARMIPAEVTLGMDEYDIKLTGRTAAMLESIKRTWTTMTLALRNTARCEALNNFDLDEFNWIKDSDTPSRFNKSPSNCYVDVLYLVKDLKKLQEDVEELKNSNSEIYEPVSDLYDRLMYHIAVSQLGTDSNIMMI